MDAAKDKPETGTGAEGQPARYRELRRHNERRVSLAQRGEAQRRRRIEQAMRVARQRRFRQAG